MNVADLCLDKPDSAGKQITAFYGRKSPDYAVYRTNERVVVHYADDTALAAAQRKHMAPLNPLRGEISGLIDGWRAPGTPFTKRAEAYERRVADALIVCLEDDYRGAEAHLLTIRQDVLAERVSRARRLYLGSAVGCALAALVLVGFATTVADFTGGTVDPWRGAASGAVGALFSVAVGMQGRTIQPDLFSLNNFVDAALRILIGFIAGAIFLSMLHSGAVEFNFGRQSSNPEEALGWAVVLVAGFVAGFSERMVSDILGQAAGKAVVAAVAPASRAPGEGPTKPAPPAPQLPHDNGVAGATLAAPEPPDPHGSTDHCASDAHLKDGDPEVTDDEDLPPASGGVAPRPEDKS
jgi:hypothetical protein